ncbi:hypothetical protein BFW01_g9647 [Lasiodiplodia theobromae]|nr:hypothetical protein BFW01_g9647 [Lasiodiplodia theobromae]
MPRPSESRRLRIAYLLTLATSISLVITSTMIIVNVGPLLPQPQRDANIRLGVILALACSATLSSALLVTTEVMNYRYHGEHFLCVPNSEAHLIRPGPGSTDATSGRNGSRAQQRRGNTAAPSSARSHSSETIQAALSNTGSEPNAKSGGTSTEAKGQNAEKVSGVATQTGRPGTF